MFSGRFGAAALAAPTAASAASATAARRVGVRVMVCTQGRWRTPTPTDPAGSIAWSNAGGRYVCSRWCRRLLRVAFGRDREHRRDPWRDGGRRPFVITAIVLARLALPLLIPRIPLIILAALVLDAVDNSLLAHFSSTTRIARSAWRATPPDAEHPQRLLSRRPELVRHTRAGVGE